MSRLLLKVYVQLPAVDVYGYATCQTIYEFVGETSAHRTDIGGVFCVHWLKKTHRLSKKHKVCIAIGLMVALHVHNTRVSLCE